MRVWTQYDEWNAALARHFFSDEFAGVPVYLDVDAETLQRVAEVIGADGADSLVQAVRSTLESQSGGPLADHAQRFHAWRRSLTRTNATRAKGASVDLAPPPVVALLTTCVLAAARMGSDPSLPAHAYYPRLGEVLGLSASESASLKRAFPLTETFWRGMNEYLETADGNLGLPTAYALGHRYVGVPQSQALVRATDRSRLPEFFDAFGLAPGSEMITADLERLLDSWITQNPSPVSNQLVRLWKGGKARERIAGVVAVELSHWDGSSRESDVSDARTRGSLELTALVRQGFGSKNVEFSFVARVPVPGQVEELVVSSADGSPRIGVVPTAGGRLRPVPGSRLDPESLIGAVVELADAGQAQKVTRRPRRVVPLRHDELLGALVEVDRIQLAEDTAIIIKDDDQLLAQATELIETYGRHGTLYRHSGSGGSSALDGLPEGWCLLADVQLLSIPQDVKRVDLHPLVPLTTAQLTFAGGLKLPGRVRKWSSLHPPEIRAVVSEAESMTVSLYDLGGDDRVLLEQWTEASQAIVVSLGAAELADGDYDVELAVRSASAAKDELISQSTLRLRSADTPDTVSWETCSRLNYELDNAFAKALGASPVSGESQIWIDGLNTVGLRQGVLGEALVSDEIQWATTRSTPRAERPSIVLGTADPKSCVVTGAHRIDLPTWRGGKSTTSQIVGVCRECGIRKTHPARPRWKQPGGPKMSLPKIEFKDFPLGPASVIDLDACLDALVHVGGGTMSVLERVASQAEGGALFLDGFVRTLESRGHIDVRRDASLQPTEWEANPAYLGETIGNGFLLAGVWSTAARSDLQRQVARHGGHLTPLSDGSGLSSWFVRSIDSDTLEIARVDAGIAAAVVRGAPRAMIDALPPLSEVEQSLPRIPIPQYAKATVFDLARAQWVTTPGVGAPGAYRVEQSFRTVSIWVDRQGAIERTCRVGTVQLVKHLAALHANRPLLSYLPGHSKLLVPMGAELPALFGRAAVLCSGLSPQVSTATRTIAYHDVPRDVADTLNALLMN